MKHRTRAAGLSCLTSAALLVSLCAAWADSGQVELVDVFVGGQDGYPAYRIPALIRSSNGVLLAFAEGRASLGDHAANDIVLKRSSDEGRIWGPLQVVDEDGDNALNNPTAVLVRETGRIILMYQRYLKGFDEHKAEPGLTVPRICRTFVSHSDDDGASWSEPVDVTDQVKRPTVVTSTATGPGVGIQLERGKFAGRILMPFNQGPYGAWKAYAAISDDRGASWRYGQTAPEGSEGRANEVQFVELSDGSILLNARNQGGDKLRKISFSHDGGETWSPTTADAMLIDPVCQASLVRYTGGSGPLSDVLLFCNPASQSARTNGTIRLSRNEGKTWPAARVLYAGSFAYSCLSALPPGRVGCLFERDGTTKISFASVGLAWVAGQETAARQE